MDMDQGYEEVNKPVNSPILMTQYHFEDGDNFHCYILLENSFSFRPVVLEIWKQCILRMFVFIQMFGFLECCKASGVFGCVFST